MPYRWLGDGTRFLFGVPTRDMDDAEWKSLDEDTRKLALKTGLYEKAKDEAKPADAPKPAPAVGDKG